MTHAWSDPRGAALAPGLAADIVTMVREEADIHLDYSPCSLSLVDRLVDGIARDGWSAEAVTRLLFGLGAYTGEVLVRGTEGSWIDFDVEQRGMFGQPFGVRTADGQVWNPLGKVVRRYEAAVENSLSLLYLSASGLARV
jgi:hypothetical protein